MAGGLKSDNKGVLYIVATPIGNLGDITYRAVEVLKNVDIIAAEDTRNTSILLEKYSITTNLLSYHKFCENAKAELFLNYLKEGKSIALVSDQGTPLICDPGNIIVKACEKQNIKIVPVAGVSAITTLLSAVSKNGEDFKFIGFIERTKNKIEKTILENKFENLVFYESPKRLLDTLLIIKEARKEAVITIGRELTKKFEEIKTDTVENIIEHYKNNPLKGEIIVLLHKINIMKNTIGLGNSSNSYDMNTFEIQDKIQKLKSLNLKDKEIAMILSKLYDLNKNQVYKECLENKN